MFVNAQTLLLLLIVPIMIAVFIWRERVRRSVLNRIGAETAIQRLADSVDYRRRRWKFALWALSFALLIAALARPVWGVDAEIVETRGIALVVVLDVSSSMAAQDVQPSRLERAKLAISDLISGSDGNLFALVLFAGDAYVQFPLTSDVDSALTFVNAASTKSISRQGTAIEDALRLALATFDERISSASMIVLMTDGENQDGDPLAAAQLAKEMGVTIHAIGYGTPEGELIPVYDNNGNLIEYKTDRGGNLITSQLDEPGLQGITETTGGLYQRATDSGVEVVNLQNRIAQVEGDLMATRFQTRPVERFGVLIALALIFLTMEMMLGEKKTEP